MLVISVNFAFIIIDMKLLIKEVAKRNGYTMRKLAEKTQIDAGALSRYNTGVIEPPFNRLQKIAEVLNCEIVEFFPVGEKYAHWIDDGVWLGINKKERR